MYDFLNIKYSFVLIGLTINWGPLEASALTLLFVPQLYSWWRKHEVTSITNCSVIIWEALVESSSEAWCTFWVVRVSWWCWGSFYWFSLDHHWDSNIVVVWDILWFISILLSDGFKGVITYNLSERFKSNTVDNIQSIGWGDFKGKVSLLIDWNVDELGVSIVLCNGTKSIGKVGMGLGAGFGHQKCLWDKLGSLSILGSIDLGDYESSKGKLYNFWKTHIF